MKRRVLRSIHLRYLLEVVGHTLVVVADSILVVVLEVVLVDNSLDLVVLVDSKPVKSIVSMSFITVIQPF